MNNQTELPNILFLVFDSFRADKFFGENKTSVTPNLDSLIKNGTYFKQAVSTADGTFLTMSSVFNGLYPFVTGVRSNEIILTKSNFLEVFKKSGYNIYGCIPDIIPLSAIKDYFKNDDSTFKVLPLMEKESFTKICPKIIESFESKKIVKPWFYYYHIQDLHFPRIVTKNFEDSKFGNTNYDKVVSSIDFWLGKFLEKIDMTKTIVIITADHGTHDIPHDGKNSAFFEPEFKTTLNVGKKLLPKSSQKIGAKMIINLRNKIRDKKLNKANEGLTPYQIRSRMPHTTLSIYDESIKIPLLFIGNGIFKNKIISNQVSALDIFPTIIELISSKNDLQQTHGRSLVKLMKGETFDEEPLFLHTIPHEKITNEDKIGLRTSKFKYFRTIEDSKTFFLYDLENDPNENNNIASDNPKIIGEMESELQKLLQNKKLETEINESKNDKEKTREQLKKMGYI